VAKLFYVLGASGAGKDSIMNMVREQLRDPLMVAHRYITRPVSSGNENHIELSEQEFDFRINRGLFAMHWQANGYRYGIGNEVCDWLAQGLDVMVNGSRAYLPTAKARFGDQLQVVWIFVTPEILQQRLQCRGRESAQEIVQRLERAIAYDSVRPADAIVIDNSGSLQSSTEQFLTQMENTVQGQKIKVAMDSPC